MIEIFFKAGAAKLRNARQLESWNHEAGGHGFWGLGRYVFYIFLWLIFSTLLFFKGRKN